MPTLAHTRITAAGSTLVLADDTLAAAKHAAEVGIITAEVLPRVRIEKELDEARPEVLPTELDGGMEMTAWPRKVERTGSRHSGR